MFEMLLELIHKHIDDVASSDRDPAVKAAMIEDYYMLLFEMDRGMDRMLNDMEKEYSK